MVNTIKKKTKNIFYATIFLLSLFILNNLNLKNEIKTNPSNIENEIIFNENLKLSDENGGGYEMNTNGFYSWIEIQGTGTHMSTISNADDNYESISLISQGWSFTFYETSYDTLYVSSNGYMSFGHPYPDDTGGNIPSFDDDNKDTIALVWEDLDPGDGGDIYYQFFGTSPNRYLVIEYYHVEDYSDGLQIGDCEVILYENGNIKFQYKSLNSHISPEIGLDHGDLINFNRYDPTLPLNSKAIEFIFDEMDPFNYNFTLNVNVSNEYSYIMNKFDDARMELFFGSEWEQSFGLLPNPSRGYKTKINITSIETNSSHWKINYESWDWIYRKDQFGGAAISSDYILHRKNPTEYVEEHNMTHYFPFFLPLPTGYYLIFSYLSDFYYIDEDDFYEDDLCIEFNEYMSINGHDIEMYGEAYYENGLLRGINLEYWNDTSNQERVILDLEFFSSEHLQDFQMNFSVDDEVSYIITQLDSDKMEQIYGSSWEQSFGFLNNPMITNKMKFNITSITQNNTHFEVDYNIWNWTDRTEIFSQNYEGVGGMIYRRDPYNYTNPMNIPYIFPFFFPISLLYPYYTYLPEEYNAYFYEYYDYCRIDYDDILMINGHEIEIEGSAIYGENGFLTGYYLEYENNTSYEDGDIINLKRAAPRNLENFSIPVELNEEYNWLIVQCNNTLMENALGSNWEADYGLPDNPHVLDKTKINVTLNIEKNETHWQTNYDLWNWISHDDQFSQSASQSDTLEFRKDPLNYTSLNMLPNIFPLFLPYPAELYLELARLEENNYDYWIDFDDNTNFTEIEYEDNIGNIWIWADAEYNPTGILHSLYIYLENDTSHETICQFEMISYVEGPKPSYIGISEDEIYEYGVYSCHYNKPEDYYINANLDRIKLNIETITGEYPSLNYSLILYNMSQMISGTYSNVGLNYMNIYEDSIVNPYSLYDILYGAYYDNYFCPTTINWNNTASFLNPSIDTVNITALSNGLKRTQLEDGKIIELISQYNSNGILETFEIYYDGKEYGSYRLNDFDHIIPENLIPIEIISPTPSEYFGSQAPEFEINPGISSERIAQMWYTLDGGVTNIPFSSNGSISQTEWEKIGSSGPVSITFYVQNTGGIINSSTVIINKDIDGPSITINSPSINQFIGLQAPNFDINIPDPTLDEMWYNLDGGDNYTISTFTGQIDQSEWEKFTTSGSITLYFFANDSLGNIGSASVIIQKDTILPIIMINSPTTGSQFEDLPPIIQLTIIETNPDNMWYTIDEDFENEIKYFASSPVDISQDIWNRIPKGNVYIRIYAEDLGDNVNSSYVIVQKTVDATEFPETDDDDKNDGNQNISFGNFFMMIAFFSIISLSISIYRKMKK